MITNSQAIEENEFMHRHKILLLRAVAVLKRIGGQEVLIQELVQRSKNESGNMLEGLGDKLNLLQRSYKENSRSFNLLQEVIDELEGGN